MSWSISGRRGARRAAKEVPSLRQVYARFGKDPRFAMLSISLDRGPTAPREFVAQQQMNWPQAFGGTASEQDRLREQWKLAGIPALFLVDPNGKIIASDLRGEGIEREVGRALASK
jgi:hypothetical protein